MHRLFAKSGRYSHPYTWSQERSQSLDLDPVYVAGEAKLSILRIMCKQMGGGSRERDSQATNEANFAMEALEWLSDPTCQLDPQKPMRQIKRPSTDASYQGHIDSLRQWNILQLVVTGVIVIYVSLYFAVPKDENYARSIFNGRRLSSHFFPPPPVNIPEIPVVMTMIAELLMTGNVYGMVCDIRHWFHQLPVGENAKRFFGVLCGNTLYRWGVLPMGWSYSPRICQCLAWAIILYKRSPASDALDTARSKIRGAKDPPRHVDLVADGRKVGFIVLTYDNIGLFCTDRNVRENITAAIQVNFQEAGIIMKVDDSLVPEKDRKVKGTRPCYEFAQSPLQSLAYRKVEPFEWDLLKEELKSFTGLEYLGVQYAFKPSRGCRQLFCRHAPKRVARWAPLTEVITRGLAEKNVSAREIAQIIGIILWHQIIRQCPLCEIATVIAISSKVSSAATGTDWHVPIVLCTTEWRLLELKLKDALINNWCPGPIPKRLTEETIIFTDACESGLGAVFVTLTGELERAPLSWVVPDNLQGSHIFILELFVAIFAINLVLKEKKNTVIRIGVDNAAVFFCLSNYYSSNLIACRWLAGLHTKLVETNCVLAPFQLMSEQNPADPPSRFTAFCHHRLRLGLTAMKEFLEGRLMPGSKRTEVRRSYEGVIRHGEFLEEGTQDDEKEDGSVENEEEFHLYNVPDMDMDHFNLS